MTGRKNQVERARAEGWREDDVERSGAERFAHRLADQYGDDLRFVPGVGWHVRQHNAFLIDTTGTVRRLVVDVLTAALDEADELRGAPGIDLRTDAVRCSTSDGISRILRAATTLPAFTSGPPDDPARREG